MYIVFDNNKIKLMYAKTFFKRLKGFMFKKNINYVLCFPKCNSIHTYFMKENIHVIMTDKENNILLIKENVSKNKVVSYKKAYYTYELPNYININYKLGDKLKIEG
jgi:uncharacterized membrane protein (UPF0127 family)